MPFRSQAQWKWAFATNQDFARRWARETPGGKRRFARLSKKIGMKAAVDEYMTTLKEREYTRDDSGKFAEKPGGGLDKAAAAQRAVDKLAKPKKGGGGGSAKPKKTEAQRLAERATEARDNAMSVLDKVGFDASDYELLSDRGAQDPNDPSVQRLIEKGLMERVGDKVYVSALGKKITSAAERGDADGAQETLDRDAAKRGEREAKRQEREAKRAEAEAEREAKRQAAEEEKKKPKGGGGGGGKKPAEEKKLDTSALKKRFDSAIARLSQRLERETDGKRAEAIKKQIEKLTAQRDKLGKTTKTDGHMPPQGVRDAAKRGLELRSQFGRGGTPVGIARARDLSNGTRVSDSTIKRMVSFFARHAVDKRPGWGDPANPTNGYIAHLLWGGDAGKAWANKIARQLDAETVKANEPTNPELWKRAIAAAKRRYSVYPSRYANAFASTWYRSRGGKWRTTKESSDGFMVYKSSDGYRWVAISSTAYLDRDKEIVSTKALKQAVARAEATGEYGPLRFWHVPGIDIGTTDYQALSNDGKFLVESGVITDEAIAQSLMKRGKGWQVSIGFEHPRLEPVNGVFENIRIFERSITPPGRAANPMTGFSMVEDGDMSIYDSLIQRVKALAYKHGKHDQKSHGRKTARRAAYQAAYSAAKAEGKSPVEARDAAKAASRVELEKRVAERRAEVARRAAERAAKRGQQQPQVDQLAGIESVTGRAGKPLLQKESRTLDGNTTPIDVAYTGLVKDYNSRWDDSIVSASKLDQLPRSVVGNIIAPSIKGEGLPPTGTVPVTRYHITKSGEVFFSNAHGDVVGVTPVSLNPHIIRPGDSFAKTDYSGSIGASRQTIAQSDANAYVSALSTQLGVPLRVGTPVITKGWASDPVAVKLQTRAQSGDNAIGTWQTRYYINDARIPRNAKVYYDNQTRSWGSRDADPSLVSQIVADYS